MKAFHNDINVKTKYVNRVLAHFEADQIIKGRYWSEGRGCAVGCTIHSSNHAAYEAELGIPKWLAKVEDDIFEGLPDERSMVWPSEFLNVIHVGADLDKALAPFMIFALESTLDKFDHKKNPHVLESVMEVIRLYKENGSAEDFKNAAANAFSAATAYTATYTYATYTYAAYTAAIAAYAAFSAANAFSATYTHATATGAYAADTPYVVFADKLLEILKGIRP